MEQRPVTLTEPLKDQKVIIRTNGIRGWTEAKRVNMNPPLFQYADGGEWREGIKFWVPKPTTKGQP